VKLDALASLRPQPREIPARLAGMFGLRYLLDRYGYNPCDEWDIDVVLGLPEGLMYRDGEIQFECKSCERWSQWPAEVADFCDDDPNNLCGGSPRRCP
jgi:hypothetical protein